MSEFVGEREVAAALEVAAVAFSAAGHSVRRAVAGARAAGVAMDLMRGNWIHCDPSGVCTGDGTPDGVTCCGECHSCNFKGCCHCSFTNEFTHCAIPGYRSAQYKGGK
ncbi:hypothetical protein niasHT_019512 [Heterodera trifolii]|uniref:Uncharacterized protein n=1 Tax=Heterodera trifolii TaxID=157864 RepID=A0ABD2KVZ5_9BILA